VLSARDLGSRNAGETIARYLDERWTRTPAVVCWETSMNLAPSDTEKLLLAVAGMVARDRLARGVRLNWPESVALLSTWVIERAREGARVEELMSTGREVLTRDQVMEGVAEMMTDVQVEATFPDGRKLVTLHAPIQ
jgi:urease subunit gamma